MRLIRNRPAQPPASPTNPNFDRAEAPGAAMPTRGVASTRQYNQASRDLHEGSGEKCGLVEQLAQHAGHTARPHAQLRPRQLQGVEHSPRDARLALFSSPLATTSTRGRSHSAVAPSALCSPSPRMTEQAPADRRWRRRLGRAGLREKSAPAPRRYSSTARSSTRASASCRASSSASIGASLATASGRSATPLAPASPSGFARPASPW